MAFHVHMIWLFRMVLNAKYRDIGISIVVLNSILVMPFVVSRGQAAGAAELSCSMKLFIIRVLRLAKYRWCGRRIVHFASSRQALRSDMIHS
jgi:hypothetical protein